MIGRDIIGKKLINGPRLRDGAEDVILKSFYPDYALESVIFWRQIEDANSGTFKIVSVDDVEKFYIFPVYNSLSILGGTLFCTMTDASDTDFTLRITFQDTADKIV